MQAAQQHVESTAQDVQVEIDKSGLRYVASSGLEFRDDIVTNDLNQQRGRLAQVVGLGLPVLGQKFAQNQAITTAGLDALTAVRAYAADKRIVLAQLREAYVFYWQHEREKSIADDYVATMSRLLPGARGLLRFGFWTQGNFLQFLVALSQARTETQSSADLQRAANARISAVLGQDVVPFRSTAPAFADGCAPRLDDAVASAVAVDPDLARLQAQTAADRKTLGQIRGSSIDASVQTTAGGVLDYPLAAGFAVGVSVAGSLPTHARAEERAHRRALEAEIADLGFQEKQRLADIRASVNEAIEDYASAKLVAQQTQREERSTRENLREARVRFSTIAQTGAAGFNEVQSRTVELFVSSRAAAAADASVLLKANSLLLLAPGACDPYYHAPAMASVPSFQPISSGSPTPAPSATPAAAPLRTPQPPDA